MTPGTSHLTDEPIAEYGDDLLDRTRYAKQLAQTIHDLPKGSSIRFGVYGDWGEGKTSVMRLVAKDLRGRGHRAAFFSPWAAATREEAWNLLVESIRKETGSRHIRYRFARGAASSARLTVATAAKVTRFDAIEDAGDQLSALLNKWKAKERTQILKQAVESLGDNKFVIFVDDLDRTDPVLLPTLLMSLRELFDLPGFVYVLGLSPTIIAEGIGQSRNNSIEHGERFLEKIVEYPSYLPSITSEGIRKVVRNAAELVPSAIRADSLEGIEQLLPKNPRRLKLFLRHLASLRHLLSRFEDNELDWSRFYASELLRLEFPSAARRLIQDEEIVKQIAARYFSRLISPSEEKEKEDLPEGKYAPNVLEHRDRFLRLTDALSARSFATGRYQLAEILTLIDSPPVLTWKEFAVMADQFQHLSADDRQPFVRRWLQDEHGLLDPSKARVTFALAIDLREQRLDVVVDTDPPDERAEAINAASVGLALIDALSDLFQVNADLLTPNEWSRLFQHVGKWSRFHHDPIVGEARRQELDILRRVTAIFPETMALELLEKIPMEDGSSIRDRSPDFLALRIDIRGQLERSATQEIVTSFRIPNRLEKYIDALWNSKGKYLLFDPESPLHSPEGRTALARVAEEADSNAEVQRNFLIYLRLILSAAIENEGELSARDCRTLISDTAFLTTLWRAAIAQPMNPRTLGTLAHHRKKLIAAGTPESALPYPRWVSNGDYDFYLAARD